MGKALTWIIVLAVIVIGGFAIFGGDESKAVSYKIGVLLPLTGDAAQYGESEYRALQVALSEINQAGGVNGRELELIPEDGKCDPQAAGTGAKKLVEVDKVKIIIGGACSGETLAAAKVTEPAKVILLSPSASSPEVTTAGDFVFRTYPSDSLAGEIAASYSVEELKARKAAVVTELTDYAQGLRKVYKQALADLGGQVVLDETYTTGDTDFKTQALKIKSSNPDVVYIVPQTATPGLALLKQLREAGVKARFATAEVLLDREVVKDNSAVLDGVIGVEPAVDWESNPKAKALRNAHREKFNGADPGTFSANAYDALFLIKQALEETQSGQSAEIDTAELRDWLYKVKGWPGAIGPVTIDKNGDPILGLNVRKIEKGAVKDLGNYKP